LTGEILLHRDFWHLRYKISYRFAPSSSRGVYPKPCFVINPANQPLGLVPDFSLRVIASGLLVHFWPLGAQLMRGVEIA
jgi:hypothetical protein